MARGKKIATAAGVWMTGLALALLFRHDGSRLKAAPADDFNRLVLQGRMEPDAPIAPTGPSTSVVPPTNPGPSPKPSQRLSATNRSSVSSLPSHFAAKNVSTAQKPLRRHKIVDGDTLPGLAQRYLGVADRASEIFALNRNVLPSPELLPIGQEIQLPPRAM